MINNINVRVYACIITDNFVLGLFEKFEGKVLLKFPGGGLEYGEGIVDCLHRELEEELHIKIEVIKHFYTQENLIISHLRENEQLLNVYYLVRMINEENFLITEESIQRAEWISLESMANPFSLLGDQIAFEKLKELSKMRFIM